ncbi:RPP30 [Branchiostoma lanceolatum]|uniref:RPP30 protein n=1 Tax=Branchiostoma lanceolatum TaxID=7740 RepID=A0A8J9ZMY5_BRALA|nr:RPP30 [Branchiostoma lanceolatum]
MARFCDFNVPYSENTENLRQIVEMAIKLGYESVAFNCVVTPGTTKGQGAQGKTFQQLTRLTAIIETHEQKYKVTANNPTITAYDILAVQPLNLKMFEAACKTLEVDIITLDMTQKLPFLLKLTPIKRAIARGAYFEIVYSPAIRDSTLRRYIISNATDLMTFCKGKNIILSSQAEKAIELRGPHDVANLGVLFGMNQVQAKDAVSINCRSVLLHAETRGSAVGVITIERIMKQTPGVISVERIPPASTDKRALEKDSGEGQDPPGKKPKIVALKKIK